MEQWIAEGNFHYIWMSRVLSVHGSSQLLEKVPTLYHKLKRSNPNMLYVCDPVLGDNNKFYVPEDVVRVYKEQILSLADILTPNEYELAWLAGTETIQSLDDAVASCRLLHQRYHIPLIILKSLRVPGHAEELVLLASHYAAAGEQKVQHCWFPRLEGTFYGTGDSFSALLIGHYCNLASPLCGNLPRSLELAVSTMQAILLKTKELNSHELRLIQSRELIEHPSATITQVTELTYDAAFVQNKVESLQQARPLLAKRLPRNNFVGGLQEAR
ncbi:putative Pyridoxal kinase [Paratrimastix pyriformis]|uniref:pyridoxal kinase n=1 Tax=Paratrimastix pyriformis TaxID=342808 RepID=A0ABQ8UVM8_9EUKA|nr:putative Pyridoxal kinase [Paratrimastix pyriformis]